MKGIPVKVAVQSEKEEKAAPHGSHAQVVGECLKIKYKNLKTMLQKHAKVIKLLMRSPNKMLKTLKVYTTQVRVTCGRKIKKLERLRPKAIPRKKIMKNLQIVEVKLQAAAVQP